MFTVNVSSEVNTFCFYIVTWKLHIIKTTWEFSECLVGRPYAVDLIYHDDLWEVSEGVSVKKQVLNEFSVQECCAHAFEHSLPLST